MFTKFQIALQYFPELMDRPGTASKRLYRMIDRCGELKRNLEKTGYSRFSKRFTSRQVALIYEYLGDP